MTMRKRSVSIRGHRTSVSLEEPFWDALNDIAKARGISTHALITEIDETRTLAIARGEAATGLSSAIRISVLQSLRER